MKIHIPAFEPILKANEHLAHGAFDIDLGDDVVQVVRCKDCEHWYRNSGIAESPNGHCFHHDIETNGYDFCSYGAKMDGQKGR